MRSGADRPAISAGPALMIPAGYPRDLPSALLRAARDFAGAGVVEIGPDGRETKLDFPTLLELAARILAGLRANGVRAGDPAVVHCTEPVGFFAAFWACTLGGIRPLLVAPNPGGDRTEEGRERLRRITDLLGWTVLIGRPSDLPNDLGLPVLDPDALAGHEPTSDFHRPAADDVAVLMLSSGTTGAPKMVQLTHRGLVEFAAGTPAMLPVRPGQTTLNWLPLDRSGAFLLYHLLPVFTGCTNIHVNTDWVLANPLRWFDLMEQHRVNHSWSPNFGYRLATAAVAGEPDRHWDLSALRSLVNAGEQITVPVMSEFLRVTNRFGVVPETFVAAWGMTETVAGITFARPGLTPNVHRVRIPPTGVVEWVDQRPSSGKVAVARPGTTRVEAPGVLSLVSVGAPAPGTTVRIVAPNGAVLPEGRIGQLQVASARVAPGYLGNLEADRAAFPVGNWPARKWLATGDQGFITGGQVVVTGRDSERIILSGKLHHAHDIESVAATVVGAEHGLVAACGIADEETGTDRLVVFYALTADSVPGMDQAIRSLIRTRLGLAAQVVGVPRRDFPTTPSGKILRPLLKQRWIDGTLEPATTPHVEPAGATSASGPTGQGPSTNPETTPYADEDPSERTTELPVVHLAWKRELQQSIPTPPQRPTLGPHANPTPPNAGPTARSTTTPSAAPSPAPPSVAPPAASSAATPNGVPAPTSSADPSGSASSADPAAASGDVPTPVVSPAPSAAAPNGVPAPTQTPGQAPSAEPSSDVPAPASSADPSASASSADMPTAAPSDAPAPVNADASSAQMPSASAPSSEAAPSAAGARAAVRPDVRRSPIGPTESPASTKFSAPPAGTSEPTQPTPAPSATTNGGQNSQQYAAARQTQADQPYAATPSETTNAKAPGRDNATPDTIPTKSPAPTSTSADRSAEAPSNPTTTQPDPSTEPTLDTTTTAPPADTTSGTVTTGPSAEPRLSPAASESESSEAATTTLATADTESSAQPPLSRGPAETEPAATEPADAEASEAEVSEAAAEPSVPEDVRADAEVSEASAEAAITEDEPADAEVSEASAEAAITEDEPADAEVSEAASTESAITEDASADGEVAEAPAESATTEDKPARQENSSPGTAAAEMPKATNDATAEADPSADADLDSGSFKQSDETISQGDASELTGSDDEKSEHAGEELADDEPATIELARITDDTQTPAPHAPAETTSDAGTAPNGDPAPKTAKSADAVDRAPKTGGPVDGAAESAGEVVPAAETANTVVRATETGGPVDGAVESAGEVVPATETAGTVDRAEKAEDADDEHATIELTRITDDTQVPAPHAPAETATDAEHSASAAPYGDPAPNTTDVADHPAKSADAGGRAADTADAVDHAAKAGGPVDGAAESADEVDRVAEAADGVDHAAGTVPVANPGRVTAQVAQAADTEVPALAAHTAEPAADETTEPADTSTSSPSAPLDVRTAEGTDTKPIQSVDSADSAGSVGGAGVRDADSVEKVDAGEDADAADGAEPRGAVDLADELDSADSAGSAGGTVAGDADSVEKVDAGEDADAADSAEPRSAVDLADEVDSAGGAGAGDADSAGKVDASEDADAADGTEPDGVVGSGDDLTLAENVDTSEGSGAADGGGSGDSAEDVAGTAAVEAVSPSSEGEPAGVVTEDLKLADDSDTAEEADGVEGISRTADEAVPDADGANADIVEGADSDESADDESAEDAELGEGTESEQSAHVSESPETDEIAGLEQSSDVEGVEAEEVDETDHADEAASSEPGSDVAGQDVDLVQGAGSGEGVEAEEVDETDEGDEVTGSGQGLDVDGEDADLVQGVGSEQVANIGIEAGDESGEGAVAGLGEGAAAGMGAGFVGGGGSDEGVESVGGVGEASPLGGDVAAATGVEGADVAVVPVVGEGGLSEGAGLEGGGASGEPDAGRGDVRAGVVEPVAVVGLAGRFPGAETLEGFWANLVGGVESVRRGMPDTGDGVVAVSGVLEHIESFDAKFFGLSDREAELMEPAQRLFLEVCHQALEHGGYAGTSSRVGVFAGSGMNLYNRQHQSRDSIATRVAYRLGLTGPAIGVQSASSSSLVAVHLACQALRSGDADLALAGAAAVQVPQATTYQPTQNSILSPSGHVRAFAADADGTVGGNGVAAVLLKRLDHALADGDTVYAVIRGTAVSNADAPPAHQAELIERALDRAGFDADSLSYIEANGIGSAAADAAEVKALTTALRRRTDKVGFCTLGSVKPNIGHLDSAAGMAGLIKTILMLQHRTLVPTINFTTPNPALGLDGSPFVIGTDAREWTVPLQSGGTTLRAGVSALDPSGTNAHVILEEAPRQIRRGDDGPVVLPLSAPDPDALADLVELYRTDLGHGTGHRLIDLAGTAALGRPAHRHRIAVAGGTEAELVDALASAQASEVPRGGPGPLGYAFTGQGAARRGMAAALAARFPVFRSVLDECDRVYHEETGGSLNELLLTPAGTAEGVWPTETAQPALFAFEVALARLWQSFGVQPALVVGHSVGEYAALCVAGALSVEDGVRLTAKRGELMQRGTVPGAMVSVRADADRVREIARSAGVEVAAGNGPQSFVLTGSEVIVGQLAAQLDQLQVVWQRLDVDRAFHSSLVDPILADFAEIVREITLKPLRTPMVSSWSGDLLESGTVLDSDYLVGQLRQPVLFGDAVEAVTAAGCRRFLELGPDAVLSPAGRRIAPNSTWIPAQRLGQDPVLATMNGLAELYEQGTEIAWAKVYADGGRVPLPTYPFRRVHHPVDPSVTMLAGPGTAVAGDNVAPRLNAFERVARAQAVVFDPPSSAAVKRIPLDPPTQPEPVPADADTADSAEERSPFALPDETHQIDADYLAQAGSLPGDEVSAERYRESLDVVLDLTCEVHGLDPYDLTVDHTFAELGATPASMAPVIDEINSRFEAELAPDDLFLTYTTPHKLATAVAVRTSEPSNPAEAAPLEPDAASAKSGAGAAASEVGPAESGAGIVAGGGTAIAEVGEPDGAETRAGQETPVHDPRAALAVLGSGLAELAAKVDEAAAATSEAELPGSGMAALMSQQLRVAGQLVDGVTKLMREQLALLGDPAAQPTDTELPPEASNQLAETPQQLPSQEAKPPASTAPADAPAPAPAAGDTVDATGVGEAAETSGVGESNDTPGVADADDLAGAGEAADTAAVGDAARVSDPTGAGDATDATAAGVEVGSAVAAGAVALRDVEGVDGRGRPVTGAARVGVLESPVGGPDADASAREGRAEGVDRWRRELGYWQRALAGAEPLVLPADGMRAVGDDAVASVRRELDAELGDAVFAYSRDRKLNPVMMMLAAVATVLGRFAAQDDVTIGSALIGPKTRTEPLPLRIDLSGEPDLGELTERIRDVTAAALDHAGADLAILQRDPLFQILVDFEDGDDELPAAIDLRFRLTHRTESNPGITCTADYRSGLFDQRTIERLLDYLAEVLRRATTRPDLRLPELTLPIESDVEALRELESDADPVGPIGRLRRNAVVAGELSGLHTLFEQQVARTPDAIAVVQGDHELTYAELDRRSNAVAWQLADLGVKPGELVAVRVARGTELVVAVLAVLKSGAAYLPLDPGVPESRWAFMVQDSAAVALVGDDAALADRLGLRLVPVTAVDGDPRARQAPPGRAAADDIAYCIYTSGSTGNPKGVVVPHRGPVNLVRHYLRTRRSLRTLQWTSFGFDVHVQEMFTTLASGAALVLIGEDDRYDPDAVVAALRDHDVQRLFMAFSPLTALLATMRRLPELPALREIVAGGEAMVLTHKVRDFLDAHPKCRLFNEYGPAEASIVTTIHEVDPAEDRPSIGRPIEGVAVRLLDAALRPVPVGAVGEIHLGGAAVAQGYIGRPEETERAFVGDPGHPGGRLYRSRDLGRWRVDGTLEYLGRADDQVKIRGHRVEPGETEHVLADQPGVVDAVVVAQQDPGGDTCLIGYLVLEDSDPAVLARLMLDLGKELPIYLVPADLIPIEELPLDDNGRLDRARLPEPEWLNP